MDDVPENVLEVAKRNPKVISFFFDVKMGDDYNKQALDLAIKAANGNEEARKDLIKVTLEFKEFKTKFDSKEFKEINKISPNTSIADYVGCQFEDGEQDWFQVVRKLLTPEQTLRVNNNFVKFEFTREVNSFADEPLPMFDEKMGDDYNTQALDLAIKAANGNEEARKELIKATLEFKELSTGLSSQDLKSIMESSVNWGYNGENSTDLFQVIRSLLTPEQTLRVNNNFFKFESKRESSLSAGEPLPMSAGSPKFTPGPDVTKFRIVTDGLSEIKKSPGVKGAPLDPKSPEFIPATDVARFIFRTDGELLSIQRGSVEVADLGSMEWETFASSDSVKAGVPLFTPPAVMNPLEVETTLANSVHNVRGVFNNRNLIDSNLKPKRLFNNAIGPTVATPDPHLQGAAGARTEPSPRGDSDKSFQSAIHRTPAPYAQSESLKSEIHQSERSPNFSTTYENGIIKFKIRSGAGKATDASSPDKFHYNKEPDQLEIIPLNKDSIKYLSENYTIEKEQEKILKLLKEASTDTIKTFSSAKLESAKLDKDFFIAVMKVASKNHGITSIESEKDFKKALKEALKEVNTASEKKYDSQEAKELNKIAKYFSAKFQRLSEKDGYLTAREGRGNEVNKTPRRLFRVCTEENIQAFQNMNIEEMEQKGGIEEVAPLSSPRSASVSVFPLPLIKSSGDRGGFF
jgi:hypothetical protein